VHLFMNNNVLSDDLSVFRGYFMRPPARMV
jgi:hypothetical protein